MKLKRRDNMSLNNEKLNGKGVFSGNFGQQRRETVGSTARRMAIPTKQLADCNKNPQKANPPADLNPPTTARYEL